VTAVQAGSPGILDDILVAARKAVISDDGNVITAQIPGPDPEAVVHLLAAAPGARLTDVLASHGHPGGEPVILRLVWALDEQQRYLVTESAVEGEMYPALSDIAAAFHEECEIYEQFGIRPASGTPLNRMVLPPHAGPDFPRLGHPPGQPPHEVHAPNTVGGQAFEFPVRARPPGRRRIALLRARDQRRGCRRRPPVHLAQAPGCGMAAAWARPGQRFVLRRANGGPVCGRQLLGVRRRRGGATGLRRPGPAARSCGVALELERLYNHAAAVAALCHTTGLSVGQSAAEIALERPLRVNAAAFGHRYLFGVVGIGGARRAPDPRAAAA
jgi:hypothetical protein